MNELIWIGNTLYPRWFAFGMLLLTVIVVAGVAYFLGTRGIR